MPAAAKTDPPANLAAALVALQAELPVVQKSKTANVPTKTGGSYRYTYADLADVTAAVVPLLVKHGLSFTCRPRIVTGGNGAPFYELAGVLLHTSGEQIEGALPLHGNGPQDIGGAITYARRYLLGCLTGVVTDDDADAYNVPPQQTAPAWHGPTAEELVDIISQHAITAGVDLDTITKKFRDQHGLSVEQLVTVPPHVLADLEASISRYLRENPPNPDGTSA